MKTKILLIVQCTFTAVLFFSWLDYQSIMSDKTAFENIRYKNTLYGSSENILKSCSRKVINTAEYEVEKYPKNKFLYTKMRAVSEMIDELCDDVTKLQDRFYLLENKVEEETLSATLLPIHYNQEADVIEIFKNKEHATKLSRSIKQRLKELNTICKINKNHFKVDFYNVKQCNEELSNLFDNEKNVIAYILNIKQFKKDILNYDVIHANALMNALKYQFRLLELELLRSMLKLTTQKNNIELDIMMLFSMNHPPMIDKATSFEIYPMNYIKSEKLDVVLNGKKIEAENGLATFQYTPKTSGDKYFNVAISFIDPFTAKPTTYKKVFRNYAIE